MHPFRFQIIPVFLSIMILLCGCASEPPKPPSSGEAAAPQPLPTAYPTWQEEAVYQKGDIVIHDGKYFKALWWTQGTVPLEDVPRDEWICIGDVPLQKGSYFQDVHDDAWYAAAINALAEDGVLYHRSQRNFWPSRPITRAEFAALLCRTLELPPAETDANFTDAGDEWYTPYLAIVFQAELFPDAENDEIFPNRHITRQEISQMIYRACEGFAENPETVLAPYSDAEEVDSFAIQAFSWCIERNILQGSGGRLLPHNTTSRAEAAQILYNLRYGAQ